MLGKTLLAALVLIHTFSTHGAEVRTVRTAGVLHILIFVCIFFAAVLITLVCFRNIGFAAGKILIGKLDKVSIKEDDFDFLRRLSGRMSTIF